MNDHREEDLLDAVAALDPVDEGSLPDGSSPTARRLLEEIMSDTLTPAPDAPSSVPEPIRPARRQRRFVAAAAAVAVSVAAVATLWPSSTPSASAAVADAIDATLDQAAGTARYTLVAEVGPATVAAGGDGAAELRAEGVIADGDLAITSRFGDTTDPDSMRVEELRLVDGTAYLRSSDTDSRWEVGDRRVLPADPLGFFEELQELTDFEEIGTDAIDGESVTVYRAEGVRWAGEPDALSSVFIAFGLFLFAGETAPGDEPPVLELFVDDAGIVRGLEVSGEDGPERFELVVEVFDLGVDVSVEAPVDVVDAGSVESG